MESSRAIQCRRHRVVQSPRCCGLCPLRTWGRMSSMAVMHSCAAWRMVGLSEHQDRCRPQCPAIPALG
eukprot:356704-Chlamydomonas_euryale.AAC.17